MEDQKSSLRFVTYNVHMWRSSTSDDNVEDVSLVLKQLNADIIGLQEVRHSEHERVLDQYYYGKNKSSNKEKHTSRLERVASNLEMEWVWGVANGGFGNVLLTNLPIISKRIIKMSVEYAEKRIAIEVAIDVTSKSDQDHHVEKNEKQKKILKVYCLHLDHLKEETRLKQIEILMKEIDTSCPHVIMGDFNSIRREDYSESYWKAISDHREISSWELPKTKVMDLLAPAKNKEPYIDVGLHWTRSHQVRHRDVNTQKDENDEKADRKLSWKEQKLGDDFRKAHKKEIEEVATCWVGTRIDYILMSTSSSKEVQA